MDSGVNVATAAAEPRVEASNTLALTAALVAAAIIGLAWNGPLTQRMLEYGDYPFHLLVAETFARTGEIAMPHFLLEVLLGGLYATGVFANIEAASVQLFSALHAATAMVLCWFIARGGRGPGELGAAVVLTLGVLMAAPILPRGADIDVFLIGYFPPNAYHNPTMLMVKPLLVLSVAAAMAVVTRTGPMRAGEWLLAVVPVALAGIAKPNYLACLLPATAVLAAWRWRQARRVSWGRVALFAAAALVSVGGTWLLYQSGELGATGGIAYAPFTVVTLHVGDDPAGIAGRLLASLAFPIAAVLLWPRAIWRDTASQIAWSALPIALFISYFIAEQGERLAHGNFLWTGQMAVFALFATTAAFARRQVFAARHNSESGPPWARLVVLFAVLALHAASGIRHVRYVLAPGDWVTWWG